MSESLSGSISGPFGPSICEFSVNTADIARMYMKKCNADISFMFTGIDQIFRYKCETTGIRFWRPSSIAGNENFYEVLSEFWPEYYRSWRWEYDIALQYIPEKSSVLEVGCGKGYFLKALEGMAEFALGLDRNRLAISGKVTEWNILNEAIEHIDSFRGKKFDVVCHYQLLEHLVDPCEFLLSCKSVLKPDGLLIFSVPNHDFPDHKNLLDAFDLPPHHMAHFSKDAVEKLAHQLNLTVIDVVEMPSPRIVVSRFQLRNALKRIWPSISPSVSHEAPGHTMVAVLRNS